MSDHTIIYVDTGEPQAREYLGDGVYVARDATQMWLETGRDGVIHRIAIDESGLSALNNYARRHGFRPLL